MALVADTALNHHSLTHSECIMHFRFLATESYRSLSYSYRVSAPAISAIIPEVCDAIWKTMSGSVMPVPDSEEQWKEIGDEFDLKWEFPNCHQFFQGNSRVSTGNCCAPSEGV